MSELNKLSSILSFIVSQQTDVVWQQFDTALFSNTVSMRCPCSFNMLIFQFYFHLQFLFQKSARITIRQSVILFLVSSPSPPKISNDDSSTCCESSRSVNKVRGAIDCRHWSGGRLSKRRHVDWVDRSTSLAELMSLLLAIWRIINVVIWVRHILLVVAARQRTVRYTPRTGIHRVTDGRRLTQRLHVVNCHLPANVTQR